LRKNKKEVPHIAKKGKLKERACEKGKRGTPYRSKGGNKIDLQNTRGKKKGKKKGFLHTKSSLIR